MNAFVQMFCAAPRVDANNWLQDSHLQDLSDAQLELAKVKKGDTVPEISLNKGYGPAEKVSLTELCRGRKVVLLGLPSPFTPTCSDLVVGYLKKVEELKEHGIDAVVCYSVVDGAVMAGWAKSLSIADSMVSFYADTTRELTENFGLVLDDTNAMDALGHARCKRFSMFIDDGEIKVINIAASDSDPVGEKLPQITNVTKMLLDIDALASK